MRPLVERGYTKGSPFVEKIMSYPTPAKLKPSMVTPKYDRSTNPIHHVQMY